MTRPEHRCTCGLVIAAFGRDRLVDDLVAADFGHLRTELAKTRGPVALGNEIQRVRVLFQWAYDEGLIDCPVRYGQSFKRPGRRTLRKHRYARGKRMFEPHQTWAMIDATGQPLKPMILLGINCSFGNADSATLPRKAVDLEAGWIDYLRPKTGVPRRRPLWPETVAALREAIASWPEPQNRRHAGLLFDTRRGNPWNKQSGDNPITKKPSSC